MLDKLGQPFLVRALQLPGDRVLLERMYAEFRPKRAAQGLPPESDYAIGRWLDRILSNGEHLIVEVNGAVCGHVMLMPMDQATDTELANFLHQGIRGRGIGTELNRFAVRHARDVGYRRVWLSVEPSNIAAIRSYTKAGFKTRSHSLWAPEIEMEIKLGV